MFNLAVYGVVDKVLLQAHILRSVLAVTLDMNDFLHVESVYLPRSASGSGPALRSASNLLPAVDAPHVVRSPMLARTVRPPSAHPAVPLSTERRTAAEEFNVSQFLVDRASPVPLPSQVGIDQYGSMLQHVAIQQCDTSDEDDTPPLRDARRQRPPPRVSPIHRPSPMDEDIERHEDPDVQGRELVIFNSQGMDVAANELVRLPPSPDGMDRSNSSVDKHVAVVTAPMEGRIVINVNDVESYGTKPHLLGDSSDSDDNDEGISHGVEMPSALEPHPMEVDAPSAASTRAGPVSAPAEDEFYNAAGKALHPDAIVPKQESGWWAARKERKWKKAQEREQAALQLREAQEQAARLAEQYATLERELRDARRSLSGVGSTAAPSTSAASVEGPVVVVSTPTGPTALPLSSRLAACIITLRASGSDVGGSEVYPRVEDRPPPSRSQCESHEDSLRFQVEDDLESGEPSQEGHGLPSHGARSGHVMDVPKRDDCMGEVGEGREEELVDYGSSPECEALEHELQAGVDVVEEESTGSDEV